MIRYSVVKENWLTKKLSNVKIVLAFLSSLSIGILVVGLSYFYLNNNIGFKQIMPASYESVFVNHEYWRLWTALFVHADLEHLLSNLLLFLPLAFILSGYFGLIIFPLVGLLMGALVNIITIHYMASTVSLIGISGLVYWMGAVWLTLYIFIDRRKSLRRRLAVSLFLTVLLFIPETYRPQVSYLSHLIGYILGVLSGLIIFGVQRKKFEAVEVIEWIDEPEDLIDLATELPNVSRHLESES